MIEFLFGNKDENALRVFAHQPEILTELQTALKKPGLYDEFLRYLSRRGHSIPASATERDWTKPYEPKEEIVEVFRSVYERPEGHWDAYEMAEKLVDVDQQFALWRFRHLKTVERIIGYKRGTGGSSGVNFLRAVVETRLFPELWEVRTRIKDVPPAV